MSSRSLRSDWKVIASVGLGFLILAGCSRAASGARDDGARDPVEVGYGSQERGQVTGSIASVDIARESPANFARLEELLEGRVAGVSVRRLPSGGFSVRVRGAGARFGTGEPLFVVDGVPLLPGPHALSGINPQNVARIEVLKDASAAAIYGSRAGNGVILITTRRGS